jgi:3D (Asp-Asp-Asp) domain-containing protein
MAVAGLIAAGQLVGRSGVASMPEPVEQLAHPPVFVMAELEHAPVRVLAIAPDTTVSRHPLPRPFAALGRSATPLIMPRLTLPRVLMPRLVNLSSAFARARPGEPLSVTLTAYCLRGTTRGGRPVRTGIIAADPRVFPLARHVELYAAGRYLGRFLVDDTGLRIKGQRIDIWTPDCDDARRFGMRTGVATLVASDAP